MGWEMFNDFGNRPMYDDFLRKSRELRQSGWEDRTFITLIDASTGIHRSFSYYLMRGSELIIYDELNGNLERALLDARGHLVSLLPLETPAHTPLLSTEEQPPELRPQS
ncbi:MAG TPA: hypothetical protein VG964_01665 [Candidatus Saccharimonadales bacterium]|nr:hypothetical protein [Candidatus Saccharimonadales bacterium]